MKAGAGAVALLLTSAAWTAAVAQPNASAAQLSAWSADLLSAGNAAEARKYCEAALMKDAAQNCLAPVIAAERAAADKKAATDKEQADATAQKAAAKLRATKAEIAARARLGAEDAEFKALAAQAAKELSAAEYNEVATRLEALEPEWRRTWDRLYERASAGWVLDLAFLAAFLLAVWIALAAARYIRRGYRGRFALQTDEWPVLGWPVRTRWVLRPLADDSDLGVTDLFVDALARAKRTLREPLQVPTLLALRPVAGEAHEPEVWRDFSISPPRTVQEIEKEVSIRFASHTVELTDAFEHLQVKVGGFDIGSLAKFARGVRRWFDAGVPTISGGVMKTDAVPPALASVLIRVTRSGDAFEPATIVSSTNHASVADAALLAAERAAYKLMYLIVRPGCSSVDVDGLAARRQGLTLLQRWVTAAPGDERRLALEKAVVNLRYARDVVHIGRIRHPRFARDEPTPLELGERVARLCELQLYEAVAHALLHNDETRLAELREAASQDKADDEASKAGASGEKGAAADAAADAADAGASGAADQPDESLEHPHLEQAFALLHSVEETADPADPAQRLTRLQAYYNHAVLEQRTGTAPSLERALRLYERVIEETTLMPDGERGRDAMLLLARTGFVIAAASYPCSEWARLDPQRIESWLRHAETLIADIKAHATDTAGADARIRAAVRADALHAHGRLVLLYCQEVVRLPLPSITAPVAAAPPQLTFARESLDSVARVRPLDGTLYEHLACAALLAGAWADARKHGRTGLRDTGVTSEILSYAAAAGACIAAGHGDLEEAAVFYAKAGQHTYPQWDAIASRMHIPRPAPIRYILN